MGYPGTNIVAVALGPEFGELGLRPGVPAGKALPGCFYMPVGPDADFGKQQLKLRNCVRFRSLYEAVRVLRAEPLVDPLAVYLFKEG